MPFTHPKCDAKCHLHTSIRQFGSYCGVLAVYYLLSGWNESFTLVLNIEIGLMTNISQNPSTVAHRNEYAPRRMKYLLLPYTNKHCELLHLAH